MQHQNASERATGSPGRNIPSACPRLISGTEYSTTAGNLPASVNWDGKIASGAVAQGRFVAELTLSYTKGDVVTATSPVFLANSQSPVLGVKLAPKYFSPDNDGIDDELFIKLSAE